MSEKKRTYTGVGSRTTPDHVNATFRYLGAEMSSRDFRLRSGHAEGADLNFEAGSLLTLGDGFSDRLGREIYLPWNGFGGRRHHYDPFQDGGDVEDQGYYVPDEHWPTYEKAVEIAWSVIPWWDKLKDSHKRLHTRNVFQVLGMGLNDPSDVLLCYAEKDTKGEPKGGTRTAIEIAKEYEVPVFNRFDYDTDDAYIEAVLAFVVELCKTKDAD